MRNIIVLLSLAVAGCSSEGSTGSMGEMGSAGAQGPAGPAGPAGPQGPKGDTGAIGAQGPQGPQGPAGNTGAQGPSGAIGPQGAQGPQGPMGLQGLQGAIGATGAVGPKGATGATGPAGPAGPGVIVTTGNGLQLGFLLSAMPNNEAYVAFGDQYTLVPDGTVVTIARAKVWYTNNDCTGTPYAVEAFGYEPIAQYLYVGLGNALFTASTSRAFASATVVQSYSMGGGACTAQSISAFVHAMTSVGSPTDPAASMPWHVGIQ